jgi:hypothetical protein
MLDLYVKYVKPMKGHPSCIRTTPNKYGIHYKDDLGCKNKCISPDQHRRWHTQSTRNRPRKRWGIYLPVAEPHRRIHATAAMHVSSARLWQGCIHPLRSLTSQRGGSSKRVHSVAAALGAIQHWCQHERICAPHSPTNRAAPPTQPLSHRDQAAHSLH